MLGVIIIKLIMKAGLSSGDRDDSGESLMQYSLGLEVFTYEQVMTPSLLSIRKRIDLNIFESLTEDLMRMGLKIKVGAK